jgi:phenylpropionate dioxygenase-like ring-hydroxylating dioxygenase large terminal subunit
VSPDRGRQTHHVGPDTPCGEYLRRFWQPVCFSDDLHDLPIRLKLPGEELVAFRDLQGNAGLLELHCPRRGTSLEFGVIDKHGTRCCYHGWLFGNDGAILEMPGEPKDSILKDRLYHGACPVEEAQGIVFAYLGPPNRRPPLPIYDIYGRPGFRLGPGQKYFYPCNSRQIMENAMGPGPHGVLHTIVSGTVFTDEFGFCPN